MDDYLFTKKDLGSLICYYPVAIRKIVESWDKNKVLGASETDLIDCLVQEVTLDAPKLHPREYWRVASDEAKIDVSHDFRYAPPIHDRSIVVDGQRITVEVPFDGDADLFDFRPSTRSNLVPQGRVSKNPPKLSITIEGVNLTAEGVKEEMRRALGNVNKYLGWCRGECEAWNSSAREEVTKILRQRKNRLLQQDDLVRQLGIGLKKRQDSDATFSVPVARKRRPVGRVPDTPREAFRPEPTVEEKDYEDILATISNLSMSIERSPTAFFGMSEEHIRDHILVSLNGVFEGSATGETFNATGKTDILIREPGGNVFVAECKIWKGESALQDAIDQLLGYVTWRDTKTALIVFSKNKEFTNVLTKISQGVPTHPNYKRTDKTVAETQTRYVFSQKNDVNRDVHVSVLAFDIPS